METVPYRAMQRGSITHSQKGKEKLVLDGFVYNCNKRWVSADGDRIAWDCELRRSGGCRAAVTTDGGYAVLSTREEHSHELREKRAQVLDTLHNVRCDAAQSDTKPAAILNRHVRKRMHAHLYHPRKCTTFPPLDLVLCKKCEASERLDCTSNGVSRTARFQYIDNNKSYRKIKIRIYV